MSFNLEQGSALTAVFATASAGAALTGLSGAVTTYSTSAFGFALNGDSFARAAVSGGATPTADGNTGGAITLTANQARAIVWTVSAAGTIQVFAGPVTSWTDATANSTVCQLPSIPGNVTPFAAHTIQAGPTTVGTWTFGSSNWNATGISAITVRNLCQLRNQPLLTT